jgi:hypothetical protein
MRIGVMQPYFYPYLGYFHLAKAVDVLVLTDNYKFTKQSWINRNRIINEKRIEYLSIPLMKSTDASRINEKIIAREFEPQDIRNKLYNSYHSSSNFEGLCEVLDSKKFLPGTNFFEALETSLKVTFKYLGIQTKIMRTSDFQFPDFFKGTDKILQICSELNASEYSNLSGGKSLYSFADFSRAGVKLSFINSKFTAYKQNSESFTSGLSIIDVIACNLDEVSLQSQLASYELVYE